MTDPHRTRRRPSYQREAEAELPLTHVSYSILLSLVSEARHGYGIIKNVHATTGGQVEIEAGTLYAAIKRMTDDEFVKPVPAPPDSDVRRRYYAITEFGRRVLYAECRRLEEMVRRARQAAVLPWAPGAEA